MRPRRLHNTRLLRPGRRAGWVWAILWAVALAMGVQGVSRALMQVTGAEHRHRAADELLVTVFEDGDVVEHAAHGHGHDHGGAHPEDHTDDHAHAHEDFERHIHDAHDSTVIAVGDTGSAPQAASSAPGVDTTGGMALLMPSTVRTPVPQEYPVVWGRNQATVWHSQVVSPLERPPRA